MDKENCRDCVYLTSDDEGNKWLCDKQMKSCDEINDCIFWDMLHCCECGNETEESFFRDDENETVCEDCYLEWLTENITDK